VINKKIFYFHLILNLTFINTKVNYITTKKFLIYETTYLLFDTLTFVLNYVKMSLDVGENYEIKYF